MPFCQFFSSSNCKNDNFYCIQGGPGGSGTGFGNFEEIGPLDVQQNSRNTTWVYIFYVKNMLWPFYKDCFIFEINGAIY